jgi:phage tail tube protein FII
MLPKTLKNFTAFVDGRGYAGRIDEVTLPKLTIKTEDFRAGGMDMPVAVDMGMEKLECDLTFAEYDPELFALYGLVNTSTNTTASALQGFGLGDAASMLKTNNVSLTLRGALQEPGKVEAIPLVINLRGFMREIDFGAWRAGDKATLKVTMDLMYYKLMYNRQDLIEIDPENMIRKINGVDQLASQKEALGV